MAFDLAQENLGCKAHLEHTDLWSLHEKESTKYNLGRFEKLWEEEGVRAAAAGESAGLGSPMLKFVLGTCLWGAGLRCACSASQFARPLLLQQILLVVEGSDAAIVGPDRAWLLAVFMFLASVGDFLTVRDPQPARIFLPCLLAFLPSCLLALLRPACSRIGRAAYIVGVVDQYSHYMHVVNKAGWRLRESLIGMLFKKVTWLSPGTKATYSSGKITNMMSSDW